MDIFSFLVGLAVNGVIAVFTFIDAYQPFIALAGLIIDAVGFSLLAYDLFRALASEAHSKQQLQTLEKLTGRVFPTGPRTSWEYEAAERRDAYSKRGAAMEMLHRRRLSVAGVIMVLTGSVLQALAILPALTAV